MTEFRYFADPHESSASTWSENPTRCDTCGESRSGYEGPYYGVDQVEFVCEDCLAGGALAERGLRTNEGDAGPSMERRDELELRTPALVSWQRFLWPVHCDDFCRFEREVGQRELEDLGDGDGAAFFRAHLHPELRDSDFDWDDLPPRGPRSREEANSPSVYLFSCLVCASAVLWWDID